MGYGKEEKNWFVYLVDGADVAYKVYIKVKSSWPCRVIARGLRVHRS